MLIQEEYVLRHNLSVSLVGHTLRESIALLRVVEGSRHLEGSLLGQPKYLFLRINWVPSDRHPGTYKIIVHQPVHDSYHRRDVYTDPIMQEFPVQYEDLETSIRSLRKKLGVKAILSHSEAVFCMWEMFICCFDSWLLRNVPAKELSLIESSVDPGIDESQRFFHLQAVLSCLSNEKSSVYDKWLDHFASIPSRLTPWLANVINGE